LQLKEELREASDDVDISDNAVTPAGPWTRTPRAEITERRLTDCTLMRLDVMEESAALSSRNVPLKSQPRCPDGLRVHSSARALTLILRLSIQTGEVGEDKE